MMQSLPRAVSQVGVATTASLRTRRCWPGSERWPRRGPHRVSGRDGIQGGHRHRLRQPGTRGQAV